MAISLPNDFAKLQNFTPKKQEYHTVYVPEAGPPEVKTHPTVAELTKYVRKTVKSKHGTGWLYLFCGERLELMVREVDDIPISVSFNIDGREVNIDLTDTVPKFKIGRI